MFLVLVIMIESKQNRNNSEIKFFERKRFNFRENLQTKWGIRLESTKNI